MQLIKEPRIPINGTIPAKIKYFDFIKSSLFIKYSAKATETSGSREYAIHATDNPNNLFTIPDEMVK